MRRKAVRSREQARAGPLRSIPSPFRNSRTQQGPKVRRLGVLPGKGSIFTYNASVEQNVLGACCEVHKKYKPCFEKLERRIVDLFVPFRNFNYYHPDQDGSASMKAVLPALTGKNYTQLYVQEGGMASWEFLRVTFTDAPEQH